MTCHYSIRAFVLRIASILVKTRSLFMNVAPGKFNSPDGGYGWVIVATCFLMSFIGDGIVFSFGVVLLELVQSLDMPASSAALVGSTFNGVMHMPSIVICPLVYTFSYRLVASAGSILMIVSFSLCLIFQTTTAMVTFYGIMGGFGMCAAYFSSVLATTDYFDTKKNLAFGIAMSGSCFGPVFIAPFFQFIMRKEGWKGVIISQIGMSVACLLASLTLRGLNTKIGPLAEESDSETKAILAHSTARLKAGHFESVSFNSGSAIVAAILLLRSIL